MYSMKRLFMFALMLGTLVLGASAQKTFSVLGDSYSTFRGAIPQGYANYYPSMGNDIATIDQTWWSLIAAQNGWTLKKNDSWSGSTICTTGYGGGDYTNQAFLNRTDRLDNPDMIFVFGGTNDSWANSPIGEYKYEDWSDADLKSFRPAVACMLKRIKDNNPESKVYVLLNSELKPEIGETFRTVAPRFDATVIELHDIEKQQGHPSIKGMQAIAAQVTEAVMASAE